VNEKLRAARLAAKWTQEETADLAKISRVTYLRIEQGIQQPQEYTIDQLCALFKRSREDLGFPPHKRRFIRFVMRKK
jgi:transcriptional regulator with XRE-family HTH domain